MEKFTQLTGVVAPLPMENVDTDMIIPKQFLKTIKRTGLGEGLFHELRHTHEGERIDDFVLHHPHYENAKILVTGKNFGCGSSREHAPWALLDYGIRCIIAESFADIFYNNCFKNGILPVALHSSHVTVIHEHAEQGHNATLTVDLERQVIAGHDGDHIEFEVDAFRRQCLLHGHDDIDLTLQKAAHIEDHESAHHERHPWLLR